MKLREGPLTALLVRACRLQGTAAELVGRMGALERRAAVVSASSTAVAATAVAVAVAGSVYTLRRVDRISRHQHHSDHSPCSPGDRAQARARRRTSAAHIVDSSSITTR